MPLAVGIDLGTSNSCVAAVRGVAPEVRLDGDGNPTQPSAVAFGHNHAVIVGRRARRQLLHAPDSTVVSVKRLVGGRYSSSDVQRLKQRAVYGIAEGEDDAVRIRVHGKLYTPEEISAHILVHMKRIAEAYLNEDIAQAVITVPAYFSDAQREATRNAATIAGIDCLRILNEPTAAALAYGFGKGRRQHVVVYDLGGGTFDVSVLRIEDDVFEVVATAGDTFLGGDDFDELLADRFLKVLENQVGTSFEHNRTVRLRLRDAAERAKIALSEVEEVDIAVPTAWRSPTGEEHAFRTTVNRYTYATWTMPLVRRTVEVCELAIKRANLGTKQVDVVLLVGGMTRYPLVREAVQQLFGRVPEGHVNPDEAVAIGAAIQAHNLTNAAVENPTVLLDVTPRTLSVGTIAGLCEPLIRANTPVPTAATRGFVSVRDDQEEVRVRVYQGESRQAEENTLLGEFVLDELPPLPRGQLRVSITFEVDADGILQVRALEDSTGRERSIRVEESVGLERTEIDEARARNLAAQPGDLTLE